MRTNPARRLTLPGARLEDALHRCILVASPHGTIQLLKPADPGVREFLLDLSETGSHRLRWVLKSAATGTELTIHRQVSWIPALGQRPPDRSTELARKLDLLAQALNLRITVLGGGTGLYTTLLGLRDRTWSLTALITGLPRPGSARDPIDELGALPSDDASLCLVALAPAAAETMVLRSLLEHRMKEGRWRGTHVGPVLLDALAETQGSRQAALDAAASLLGMRGRIVLAHERSSPGGDSRMPSAADAIHEADMVVIAPGHVGRDTLPLLSAPGIGEALRATSAIKVVVTKIMTAEGDPQDQPTTSDQVRALATAGSVAFDVVLANSAAFTLEQLRAYAAVGARPVLPDLDQTAPYAGRVLTEKLVASGHLARHDPTRLGESLIEIGTESLLAPPPTADPRLSPPSPARSVTSAG